MTRIAAALLAVAALGLARPAAAQIASGGGTELFRSDAAGVRIEPEYQPTPLTIGPVVADVRMTAQSGIDSNVFRVAHGAQSDVTVAVVPSVRLLGSFGPHSATLAARAEIKRHRKFSRENAENIDISFGGRVSLGPVSEAGWLTQFSRQAEPRGSAGSNVTGAGAANYHTLGASFTARTGFGRLSVSTGVGIAEARYAALALGGGSRIDQSFRDTRAVNVAPRINFALTPTASMFLAGSATQTRSLNRSAVPLRDAGSYALLAGFRTEADSLIVGEVGLGWRGQKYRNPRFQDFSGLTYDATVDWYPTPLVSLRVQAGRDVVNSGLTTVAGIVRRTVGARLYYDPMRKLRFSLSVDRDSDRFREIGLTTRTVSTGLTGRYLIGQHLVASAYARFQVKDSSDGTRGFRSVAAGLSLTGSL